VYAAVFPAVPDGGPVTARENKLVMVMVRVALLAESATLVAVSDMLGDEVRICRATYMPSASIVPTAAFPPGTPSTLQVTAAFDVLLTVAVKVCGPPSRTEALDGATVTVAVEGGGCAGSDPASPAQPRKEATRSSAGHQ
jgi:hypothetical protein